MHQFFWASLTPSSPKPEMSAYLRGVEDELHARLSDPAVFRLAAGERVARVLTYHSSARASDTRAFRANKVISDVHTDFTRGSGPAVLEHILRETRSFGHH